MLRIFFETQCIYELWCLPVYVLLKLQTLLLVIDKEANEAGWQITADCSETSAELSALNQCSETVQLVQQKREESIRQFGDCSYHSK